jgi:hypothetical protein
VTVAAWATSIFLARRNAIQRQQLGHLGEQEV